MSDCDRCDWTAPPPPPDTGEWTELQLAHWKFSQQWSHLVDAHPDELARSSRRTKEIASRIIREGFDA